MAYYGSYSNTDDLVQMAHTREELAKKLAALKAWLDSKGMKVDAEKSKIVVGGTGMGVIQQTWLCGSVEREYN